MSGTGQRYILPYFTAFDTFGVVSPGALLNFYLTGTSTPENTYADQALTTPNSNPVVADGAGLFPSIFLIPGIAYKVVLTTAGASQIWTADPVGLTSPAVSVTTIILSGSGNYPTPANARQLQVRFLGGGSGGAGVSGGGVFVNPAKGGDTSFNSVVATGGTPPAGAVGGGNTTAGTGAALDRVQGMGGFTGGTAAIGNQSPAGNGGISTRGGAGSGAILAPGSHNGGAAAANSGSGGGGAATSSGDAGAGGSAAETVWYIINNPTGNYPYTVGAGTAGGVGASATGGAGASGHISVTATF